MAKVKEPTTDPKGDIKEPEKLVPMPPAPRVGKFIENEFVGALITYLNSRPHGEVRNLIDGLSRLPDATVTFNN